MPVDLETLIIRFRNERAAYAQNEEATKQGVILPILSRLDWDRDNISEVVPEYSAGTGRVDYCLKVGDQQLAFIEAKRMSEDLDTHQAQLLQYAFHAGVKVAVLTNGAIWWFYLPLAEGSWEQRRFYAIDILQQDPAAAIERFKQFLTRSNLLNGETVRIAESMQAGREKKRRIAEAIPKAWRQACSEPDELLCELLAERVESICGHKPDNETVSEFLAKVMTSPVAETRQTPPVQPRILAATETPIQITSASDTAVYTFMRPRAFVFNGQRKQVHNFKDVLRHLCKMLYDKHSGEYRKVLQLRGRTRRYFDLSSENMTAPARIGNTEYFVETNLSANDVMRRCYALVNTFGYPEGALTVDCVERAGNDTNEM